MPFNELHDKNGNIRTVNVTTELAYAWGMRGLIAVLGIAGSIVGWLVVDRVEKLDGAIEANAKSMWTSVSKLNDAEAVTDRNVGILTQSVQDNLKSNSDAISRLTASEQDHENRIRTLERPPGHN